MDRTPRSVCPVRAMLGKGPVWVDDSLWFVDIKGRKVHRFVPAQAAQPLAGNLLAFDVDVPGNPGARIARRNAIK